MGSRHWQPSFIRGQLADVELAPFVPLGDVVAGVIATALAVTAVFRGLTPPAPLVGPVARFTVSVSPADRLEGVLVSGGSQVAISRDGTLLAYWPD